MRSAAKGKTASGSLHRKVLTLLFLAFVIIAAIVAQILLRPDRKASLKIVYTGGIQGHYQYEEGVSAGYGRIRAAADVFTDDGYAVVLLDSGSGLGGSSRAELSGGEGMLRLMNASGYSGMTPASLDFVYGLDQLKTLRTQAAFPFLVCNLRYADGTKAFEDYKVMNINGVRIGITGVTDGLSQQLTAREGLGYADPVESVREAIADMGGRVDAFIVLACVDDTEIVDRIARIEDVDLVITGAGEEAGTREEASGALVVTPAANGSSIGVVTLNIRRNRVLLDHSLITEDEYKEYPEAEAVTGVMADVEKDIQTRMDASVVLSEEYIEENTDSEENSPESPVGFLTADAMLWEGASYSADCALIRTEEIQGTLSGGRLKLEDVFSLYDDDLNMVICRMTGGELRDILEKSLAGYPEEDASFLQVSGIRCNFSAGRSMGSRLSDIIVGSSSLDDAGTYYAAMTGKMAKEYGFGTRSGGFEAACRSVACIVGDYMSGDKGIVTPILPEQEEEDIEEDDPVAGSLLSARIRIR